MQVISKSIEADANNQVLRANPFPAGVISYNRPSMDAHTSDLER